MGAAGRRGRMMTALLALALPMTACDQIVDRTGGTLRVGYDSMDGSLAVWPPRGALAGDTSVTEAVTEAVSQWRSPVDDRAHLPTSGILWSGELDGAALALVAADVPGESSSWLLQLSRDGDRYVVDQAAEYTDPGYLVYSDVLPVLSSTGRRYLTSARVARLVGPDDRPLTSTDGLTEPVDVPSCTAVPVVATLRATEALPEGKPADRLLDLGTGISAPRYPLVGDESGSGVKALAGLDTCLLAGAEGPFGSIPRRIGEQDAPESVPASWPRDKVTIRSLGEITLDGTDGARTKLEQLTWGTDSGSMTAVLHRPAAGAPPVVSEADRANPLQIYELPVPGAPLVVLSWRATRDSSLSVPSGTPRLVDRPGLVVVPLPATKETFSLANPDKTYYRSVGGR